MKTKKVIARSMPLSCGFCAKVTGMDKRLKEIKKNIKGGAGSMLVLSWSFVQLGAWTQ